MWPEGQLWKPGPSYPATVAAPNVSPNVILAWGRIRITGFGLADEDVSAPGPSMETGAGVDVRLGVAGFLLS